MNKMRMSKMSKQLWGTSELRSAICNGSGHFRVGESANLVIYGLSWVLKTSILAPRFARPLHAGTLEVVRVSFNFLSALNAETILLVRLCRLRHTLHQA